MHLAIQVQKLAGNGLSMQPVASVFFFVLSNLARRDQINFGMIQDAISTSSLLSGCSGEEAPDQLVQAPPHLRLLTRRSAIGSVPCSIEVSYSFQAGLGRQGGRRVVLDSNAQDAQGFGAGPVSS